MFAGSQESNLIEFRTQFNLQAHRIGHPCILCPISHYERVLFPFVNNLNIFSSLLVYISPLKVLCILFCWLFIYLVPFKTKHRPPRTLVQNAFGGQFLFFPAFPHLEDKFNCPLPILCCTQLDLAFLLKTMSHFS